MGAGQVDVQGSVVTTDALNTQKKVAAAIQEGGGDYVLALKENHPHLFEDVSATFAWCQNKAGNGEQLYTNQWQSSEWDHGRHEVRRGCSLAIVPEEWPQAVEQWAGLQSLILVERQRKV